jgi:dTDP-4-dehydrorhamnose 3,5-epimerase
MNVELTPLTLEACYAGHLPIFSDERGSFQKLFHADTFQALLPGFLPRECYLTRSAKGVLRGMHFQPPPHDHGKIVICLGGAVLDGIVDLRAGDGFGLTTTVELDPEGTNCVVLPRGVGHGFYSHEDNSQLLYLVETVHAPEVDAGILWNTVGIDWPVDDPILSARDTAHPPLSKLDMPLKWRPTN